MLHMLRNSDEALREIGKQSPLKAWLLRHGHDTLSKFAQLEMSGYKHPLVFQASFANTLTRMIEKFGNTNTPYK